SVLGAFGGVPGGTGRQGQGQGQNDEGQGKPGHRHAGKPSGEKTTARGGGPSRRCLHTVGAHPLCVERPRWCRPGVAGCSGASLARLRPRADQRLRGDQSMGSSSTTTSKSTSSPSTEVVVTVTP